MKDDEYFDNKAKANGKKTSNLLNLVANFNMMLCFASFIILCLALLELYKLQVNGFFLLICMIIFMPIIGMAMNYSYNLSKRRE